MYQHRLTPPNQPAVYLRWNSVGTGITRRHRDNPNVLAITVYERYMSDISTSKYVNHVRNTFVCPVIRYFVSIVMRECHGRWATSAIAGGKQSAEYISIIINPLPCSRSINLNRNYHTAVFAITQLRATGKAASGVSPPVFHSCANSKPTESRGEYYQWCFHRKYVPLMSELNQPRVAEGG